MQHRDQQLLALRPKLNLPLGRSTEAERFQNQTLRPVLKMQHEVVLAVFKSHVQKTYGNAIESMNTFDQHAFIAKTLRSDLAVRNQLIGIVLGQFTLQEIETYFQDQEELRRRFITLIVQRIQSVYSD